MSILKNELYAIASKHDIINRAWDAFWESYDSYITEEQEEAQKIGLTNRYSVSVILHSMSYVTQIEYEYDAICVNIRMKKDDSYIGYYDLLFTENGEIMDDYFVIE